MSDADPELCDRHIWVAVGVTTVEGAVVRVWTCEQCPAWTRQRMADRFEVDWADANVGTP